MNEITTLPAASMLRLLPFVQARPADVPVAVAFPMSRCGSCAVRQMCLPAGLDTEGDTVLRKLLMGPRRLRKGQRLYLAGEPFQFLYAVRCGTLKSTLPLANGGEQVTGFHLAGDLLGLDGPANGQHPTGAVALENADTCAISYAQLLEACAESRTLRRRVGQLMAAQLVREHATMELIARSHTEARVAGFLLLMAQCMRQRGYSPREFQLRMSRAEIGSYLGMSLETVSRSLSTFDRAGLVRVRSRSIELLNPEELQRAHAG
jgi:CRP/FNR family transcriptional regulator